MKNKLDLFEFLQYILGCTYISDLRDEPYNSRAKVLLQNIRLRKYSFKQIKDAIQYLYFRKNK